MPKKEEMLGMATGVGCVRCCDLVSARAMERIDTHLALSPSMGFLGLKNASRLIFGCRVGACTIKKERGLSVK